MRRPTVIALCAILGVVIVAGILLQGVPTFTGIRWVPDFAQQPSHSAAPPTQPAEQNPAASPQPASHPFVLDGTPILWLAIAALVIIAGLLIGRALRRRRERRVLPIDGARVIGAVEPPEAEPPTEPEAPALQRGFDRALATLETEREPRDAIERAWLGLQEAAEESGVRRLAAETPAEFTARVLTRVHTDESAVRALLGVYVRVRFGDGPVTDSDRALALDSLRRLADSWSDPAADRTSAGNGGVRD